MTGINRNSEVRITSAAAPEADALAEGWTQVEVGTVLHLTNGFPFKPAQWKQTGLPIIRIQNLNNSGAKFNRCPDAIPNKYLVRSGDLLFAWSGTPGTSFGAHIWKGGNAWLNQHIFRVGFDDRLFDRDFLRLAINENVHEYIQEAQGGVGLAHITKKKFDASYLPLPPLSEQKRIATKVEQSLVQVTAACDHLAKIPAILKRFRQAALAAACSGRLTEDWRPAHPQEESVASLLETIAGHRAISEVRSGEDPIAPPETPDQWIWSRCEYLCDRDRAITYGVIKLGLPVPDGVPTLRSSDVRWLYIDNSRVKRIAPEIASAYGRTFLRGGEVLVTVRGTLGGVGVVSKGMEGFNISREVAMLPVHPLLNATFFAYAIAASWSQSWLSEKKRGVAYTGINIGDLKRLPLPVPPIAEQHEIVRRVDALFRLADAIERRAAAATAHTDKLTQAILAKAFRGELVPTEADLARREGRSYESAAELLARIQAERAASCDGQPSQRGRPPRKNRRIKPSPPTTSQETP